ncbi:MAG: hypothetical protein ABIO70_09880 [Pseudomonadota bacterium]
MFGSFGVLFRALDVLLVLAIIVVVPTTALREYLTDLIMRWMALGLPAHGVSLDPQQGPILAMTVAEILVLPWTCVVGTFAAAAILHVYMRDVTGKRAEIGDTISQALFHWRRLIVPFTLATLVIWVGSIVVIPGILYTLLYAFVVPVAILDPGVKHVLRRSTRLTRGRRGRIFRAYVAFGWWWGWYATVGALMLHGQEWWKVYTANLCDELVGFAISFILFGLYLERKKQLAEILADDAAPQA